MTDKLYNVIIIGSGPSGLTAGIYASRAQLSPLILEGKNPGGQLMGTTYVENWPGEKSILGPDLMLRMKEHATHLGTTFLAHEVVKVDLTKRPFTVWTHRDLELKCRSIIIATGAVPNRLGCPGEDIYWGKGVTTCAVCDGAFYKDQEVVIVGGGDTAMEDASFMTKFTQKITIVQINDKLTASAAMQHRVLNNPAITIVYNSTVKTVEGNENHLTHITIKNNQTGQEYTKEARALFVAIGLSPNTKIFKDQLVLDRHGYIQIENHTHTSVPGVFACGDVADYRYRQAIVSAGAGCMAALDAERFLANLNE